MWGKIRQKYYDIPLAGKIALAFGSFLLAFCIVSQAALQFCLEAYDEKLYEKSLQELDYFTQEVNRSIGEIEKLSADIAMDDDVQEQLAALKEMNEVDAAYSLGVLNLRELLMSGINADSNVRSATYYDGRMTDILVGTKVKAVPLEVRESMDDALLDARGRCVTRNPDAQWPYFLAGRNILEKENARLAYLGTLILSCDVAGVIRKNVANLEAEHDSLYVYTDQYMIYQDEGIAGLQLPACEAAKGYRIVKVGRQRYFMCYLYSPATGWMYANAFPYTEIYGQIRFIRVLLLAIILVMALLVMAGMTGIARNITRPLNDLAASMRIVETGDFTGARESLVLENRKDETGQLQKEFDTMLERV